MDNSRFLRIDEELANRSYQINALEQILSLQKCLVKMFCGTGKSKVIINTVIHKKKTLSVIVFPSLALIRQFTEDYLSKNPFQKHCKNHKTINISSEVLSNIDSTTNPDTIKSFLNQQDSKVVLVTYQSLNVLLGCLETKKSGLIIYDEAHHVVSPEYQKLVFGTDYFEKEIFFTATPRNDNGIIMHDRDTSSSHCGELAFEYTYLQALKDKVVNAFDICVDMYTENTNFSIYEAIARAILSRGTTRILTFHANVNGDSGTSVWNFVNESDFINSFQKTN